MQQQLKINSAQYELLNVLSCVNKEEDVAELKSIIVQFLNTRLQKEIDRLWDDGTLTEEKHFNILKDIPFPHVEVKKLSEFHQELI